MQERRQKLLNLNKIRGFGESHPISVSGDARYNNRLESGVGKTPFQPATQSVYCISEKGTGMPADKNNARRPSTPSGELWRPT
jgi:hypothetical protein